ncbi:nucleotidyltransferase [Yersinia ruckeri]|uniref:SMODS domain-containing nucleotidyltransferase n=1 Tax=Yersinia ruckeri TaxID=29486 RepID=UPI0022387EF1|nr:nucleotidyltransferase [Yersinia ruckeri]EKN3347141.1 nucleotidyltransferase [Yersinia ruckeri]EKN4208399.1 nucleotidyltransferase [Yersinia ruckeri]ELM3739733.1 nucleotidyltransferase [Yersinia ruckeri]ELM3748644.1 nucleotidyltransferase [Yersinia ruckeri]MCW6634181.1 nucleotidyltransferase [Yersinia ruckeri]
MATTVISAFDEFQKDIVNLNPDVTGNARTSRDWLLGKIAGFEAQDDKFPHLYHDINIGFGSFARHTKIRPLNDIDLMIGLGADQCFYVEHADKITISTKPETVRLTGYLHDNSDYVNSRKVINAFVSSLKNVGQYDKADINRNQEAATLKLKSYDWNFDIVPCFQTQTDTYGNSYYLIPDGNGHWKKTDPRIDRSKIKELNQRFGGNLLNVIRVVKYWQKRQTMPSMGSYLLETMLLSYYSNRLNCQQWVDLELHDIFTHLASAVYLPVWDHKGIQGDINGLTYEDKVKISVRCTLDAARVNEARRYESAQDNKTSIGIWRDILGDNFPLYG